MEQYLTLIVTGLYNIVCERYHRDIKEARLILAIMAQACRDLHSKGSSDGDRRGALSYLHSNAFLYHCRLLALDDVPVRILLLETPKLSRKVTLPSTES